MIKLLAQKQIISYIKKLKVENGFQVNNAYSRMLNKSKKKMRYNTTQYYEKAHPVV